MLPPPTHAPSTPRTPVCPQPRRHRLLVGAACLGVSVLLVALTAVPAFAVVPGAAEGALGGIISRLRLLILGLASGLAALFLTIAGIRLLFGADDPAQVEKGKKGLRSVAIGYGVALLAVSLVSILDYLAGA